MCVITTQNAFLPSFTSGFEKPHNTLKSCAREKRKVDAIISPIYPSIMLEERPFHRNNIIQKPFLTWFIQGQLAYFASHKLVLCKLGLFQVYLVISHSKIWQSFFHRIRIKENFFSENIIVFVVRFLMSTLEWYCHCFLFLGNYFCRRRQS